METEGIPLTGFDARSRSLLPRLKELKAPVRELGMSLPGGGR